MKLKVVGRDILSEPDNTSFDWTSRQDEDGGRLPTFLCLLGGTFYHLNNFNTDICEGVIVEDIDKIEEALHFSIGIYNLKPNVVELSNIFDIITKFGGNPSDCKIFEENNVGNINQMSVLSKISKLPGNIKTFISLKNLSVKNSLLLIKLKPQIIDKIDKIIVESHFSVSDFRNFINDLKDFQDEINIHEDLFSEIELLKNKYSEYKSEIVDEIYKRFFIDNKINISNRSDFETPEFTVSFTFSTPEEYKKIVGKLSESLTKVEDVYQVMRQNDICS